MSALGYHSQVIKVFQQGLVFSKWQNDGGLFPFLVGDELSIRAHVAIILVVP